jgi:alcohol dehydrogenase class IV
MSFAALASGLCLTCAGLGAVHGFASSIGGMFDIPHGIICGTLMAGTNEMMVRKLRKSGNDPVTLEKYAILGEIFLGEKDKSNDYYIDGFISFLHEMTDRLHLPGLKSSGMDGNALEHICAITDVKKNPVTLNNDELMEILSKRLT